MNSPPGSGSGGHSPPAWAGLRAPLAVAAAAAVVVIWQILPLVPMDEDSWYFFALGRWLGEHAGSGDGWIGLVTEYFNPREPIFRPVTNVWFGAVWALVGPRWWAWMIVTLILHVFGAWLVSAIGARLGLSPRAAALAGLLWALHPLQAELLGWVNAQETQVMALLVLLAVRAQQADRVVLAGVLTLLAASAREQGITAAGAVILVDLAIGQRDWRRWVPVVTAAALVLLWRVLVLAEPDNAMHAEYTAQFMAVPLWERVYGILVVAPAVVLAPMSSAAAWGVAAVLVTVLALGVRRAERTWIVIALLWLCGIVLPASADLVLPVEGKAGLLPSWNLRHVIPALAGPCWLLAAALDRLHQRDHGWSAAAVLAVLGGALIVNLLPYQAATERARAAIDAIDDRQWAANEAVRAVEPLDPLAAALQYRPLAIPEAGTAPLLVGEPRCGCVMRPPNTDLSDLPTARALSERLFSQHLDASGARAAGDACGCPRWREDAVWLVFDGHQFGPE